MGSCIVIHTGLFLSGAGGVGKSHTVIDELHAQRAKYVLYNSRLTARGLVDVLAANPDDIILIEDAETLFRDPKSAGVLRSALCSLSPAKPMERSITWKVGGKHIQFIFTGSIIVISNSDLTDELPEIQAMKTRVTVLRLDVTNDELLALMKKICGDGYQFGDEFMSPAECWEVAKFIRQIVFQICSVHWTCVC